MKKAIHIAVAAAFLAGIGFSVPAMADAKSDIKERIALMKTNGKAAKALKGLLGDPAMNKAAIVKEAKNLVDSAAEYGKHWIAGSGMAAGKTRAKDEIWSNPGGFKKATADFQKAATALLVAAEAGDAAKMKSANAAVGKSCGDCHKLFRGKKT